MIIKVSREKLIAAIEARRNEEQKALEQDAKLYPAKFALWKVEVEEALRNAASQVRAARTPEQIHAAVGERYNRSEWFKLNNEPSAPHPHNNTLSKYDGVLKRLRLSDDEFIRLDDKSDYARYI